MGEEKIKLKKVPTILSQGKDPIRYPKVVGGYEKEARQIYNTIQSTTFEQIVKEMVKIQNKHL